jgi:hypothetical protein
MSGYKTKLIVAAIDFGTTYSGYAHSLKDEYKKDPLKVFFTFDFVSRVLLLLNNIGNSSRIYFIFYIIIVYMFQLYSLLYKKHNKGK